jgi:hypothetical protein
MWPGLIPQLVMLVVLVVATTAAGLILTDRLQSYLAASRQATLEDFADREKDD